MFKSRLFLYGLGLGLIIASVLVQLSSFAEMDISDRESVQQQEWANRLFKHNIQLIKDTAEKNDLMLVSSDKLVNIRQESQIEVQALRKKLEEEIINNSNIRKSFSFIISAGMSSDEVVKQLLALELIRNEAEFIQVLKDKQLNTKIQAGLYHFEGTPNIEEIIERITKDS